jgi:hypothetical protein
VRHRTLGVLQAAAPGRSIQYSKGHGIIYNTVTNSYRTVAPYRAVHLVRNSEPPLPKDRGRSLFAPPPLAHEASAPPGPCCLVARFNRLDGSPAVSKMIQKGSRPASPDYASHFSFIESRVPLPGPLQPFPFLHLQYNKCVVCDSSR